MSEPGCFKDGAFQNLSVNNTKLDHIESAFLEFLTFNPRNLNVDKTTLVDTGADITETLSVDTLYEMTWDGDNTCTLTLPRADPGSRVELHFIAQCDGGDDLIVKCAPAGTDGYGRLTTSDHFKEQNLKFQTQDRGDRSLIPTVVGVDDVALPDNTFTTEDTQLTMVMTAVHNQTNIGAKLSFYCENTNSWTIAFRGSELGDGTINVGGLIPGP